MQQRVTSRARAHRNLEVRGLARNQEGVVSRRQLLALGFTRWQIEAELRAMRWRAHGRQTVAVHTGELTGCAIYWYATFEAGPRSAIDGHSALVLAGLTGFTLPHIRVSVPRGAPVARRTGLNVRQTRRLQADDVITSGVRRVRPSIAAVRAGLWARSNRQAATLLAMTVQQRLATADDVGLALLRVRRDKRRRFLEAIVVDLLSGAHSLGELDFAQLCRRHGLPEPDRQSVRKGPDGRTYLDVWWDEYRVVVEVDGIQHQWVQASIPEARRQNRVSIDGETVLRIPVLGLRVASAEFMAQVAEALRAGGWASGTHNVIGDEGDSPQSL